MQGMCFLPCLLCFTQQPEPCAVTCRFWFDSELLWENPKDVRPYHVQTAWYWSPDADVTSSMIKVKSVSSDILVKA